MKKLLLYTAIGVSVALFLQRSLHVPTRHIVLFCLITLLVTQVAKYFLSRNKRARRMPDENRTIWRSGPYVKAGQLRVDPKRVEAIINRPARSTTETPEPQASADPVPPAVPETNSGPSELARQEFNSFEMGTPVEGPDPFSAFVAEVSRPAVIAYRPYPPFRRPAGRSKVGGYPDLPAGVEWPRTVDETDFVKAGAPLHFMAQIDLSELPWRPKDCP
ncbi:MAG: DUF1963 domain-containing protein, partial [Gammaproteobacteria bacterium]|nr:DUF1963 domain-containing protein [Gammaproteobacteria bacterium]